jgi:hypothetical protein
MGMPRSEQEPFQASLATHSRIRLTTRVPKELSTALIVGGHLILGTSRYTEVLNHPIVANQERVS